MSDERKVDEGRRGFLKMATAAGPAAAVAAVAGPTEAEEAEAQGSGLRKTAHVKKYLESARF